MKQTNKIHPTAIINVNDLELGDNVEIGPYTVMEGKKVVIGDDSVIGAHCYISGITIIGSNTSVFPHAVIGTPPQDLKYKGEESSVVIGSNTVIREHVTIHKGTGLGLMSTHIGDNCLIMADSHIAHDCVIEDNVIISHNAVLGGHVRVEEGANIGGLTAIHQNVVIGKCALIGGGSAVVRNVIPYGNVYGERASLMGINVIGMRRKGCSKEEIMEFLSAYEAIFVSNDDSIIADRIQQWLKNGQSNKYVAEVLDFMSAQTGRPICMPKSDN